jgi:glycine cleavage system H protein
MSHPSDRVYSKEHEWVVVDGDVATIGISDFAQDQLGEVVYVDLPSVGDDVNAGETFGEIESVKSVSELYSPVAGEVVKVNDGLSDSPEVVNEDCYGEGWMIEVKMGDASEVDGLMTAADYEAFIADEA